jgi:hypothetical protein
MAEVADIQKQNLDHGFIGRKYLTVGDVLAHLGVQALNGIGGVNHFAQLDRILEESGQIILMMTPSRHRHGITSLLSLREAIQSQCGSFDGGCRINRPHSGRRSFQATNLVTLRMWWTTHS